MFVERGLEEKLEVAHETSVVTILVLGKDGDETVILLILNFGAFGNRREVERSLDCSYKSNRPQGTGDTHLNKKSVSSYTYTDRRHYWLKTAGRFGRVKLIVRVTYARDGLGHTAEDRNVPRVDFRSSHLLVVGIEPQVMGSVGSEILLISAQVQVPHY